MSVYVPLAVLVLSLGAIAWTPSAAPAGDPTLVEQGREIFRHDTFGDEAFWGDKLRLHEAIAGAANGGVGEGVSPHLALRLGLKVDVEALPRELQEGIASGEVDLDDPATTIELLRQDSVLGVSGFFDDEDQLSSVGISCALCHSTVDDSFAPGLGKRLDGWPNQDLDIGLVVSFAPDLSAYSDLLGVTQDEVRDVLRSWGPGKFDAELILDGKAFQPDGSSAATLIPPAYGLQGVNLHTWTGWGSITHWNAFVANLEMHGVGTFFDPRLDDASKFPIAAANGFGHIVPPDGQEDRITPALAPLQAYQLSLEPPRAPEGSFDPVAAERGQELFEGTAGCAGCHVAPLFTEPGWNLQTPEEMGIDSFQADRSPDGAYRTTPLRGLWSHTKRGFFHDGRFPTLQDVIRHYNQHFSLGLSPQNAQDLEQYLLSL